MFDSLTNLFEGKNINQNMTLRNRLKNVKIQNEETIQSYLTRVSQIKEQLEAMREDIENGSCDDHLEWSAYVTGLLYPRNLC